MAPSLNRFINEYFSPTAWGQRDEAAAKYRWILKLRWIALLVQLSSIWPGVELGFLAHEDIIPFTGIVLFLGIINLVSVRLPKNLKVRPVHLFSQLTVDLIVLLALLFLTGGLQNPFVTLLLFHAVLSSLLLETKWNISYFGLISFGLLGLYWAPLPRAVLHNPIHTSIILASQLVVALAIWILTSWLSRTLIAFRSHVSHLELHQNRMDRLRAIGALAAGFSHEFATPLNTIKLRLDRLERKLNCSEHPNSQDDFLIAKEAIAQCDSSLKSLHRSQVDENNWTLQIVSMDSFIKGICEEWQTDHPDADLQFSVTPGGRYLCRVPQLALSQTLLNLLDNAWESAPLVSIRVQLTADEDWIALNICDNGPGIPALVLKKLGEPFVTTKTDGTGLGLFNAVNLVGALGGNFEVTNLPSKGAEAKIRFRSEVSAL